MIVFFHSFFEKHLDFLDHLQKIVIFDF